VSPDGRRMAMVAGGLQGDAFDLVIVDLPGGAARRLRIQRGANGPPAWLDETTVVTDVITPDGASGIAAIDVDGGAVTDRVGPWANAVSIPLGGDGPATIAWLR